MKIGMYVRCPIEFEFNDKPRRFAIGRIVHINAMQHEVKVSFHLPGDAETIHEVYRIPKQETYPFNQVTRSKILQQTPLLHVKSRIRGMLLFYAHTDSEEFHHYFVQLEGDSTIQQFSERDIIVPITRGDIDVLEIFRNYEFHNPQWFLHRQIVVNSLHTLHNAMFGFETLIGSRVFLMEHQVDTIVRAISDDPCRFILADEVGLGKTIEAAVIMKGLQKRLGRIRIILIVPESLLYQWRNEMTYKFWTDFIVYEGQSNQLSEDLLLFPLEQVETTVGQQLLQKPWDLCIVDETHRLLSMKLAYERIYSFSQKVQHLLLLSATPIQSRQTEFLRLVCLLDPQKYGEMSEGQFEGLLEKQAFIRRKVYRMMQDIPAYYEDKLADGFEEDLNDISEVLGDTNFQKLIDTIDIQCEDEGLSQVKLALAYLGENYQIERKILRHRRKELESSLGKRTLYEGKYEMKGSDVQYYECDTNDVLIEYLEYIEESSRHPKAGEYQRWFLSALFSSPWALAAAIVMRQEVINGERHKITGGKADIILQMPVQDAEKEKEYLNVVASYTERWRQATELELRRVDECFDDPDLIQGRLMKVMDHILSETDEEKVVLFASWKETLLPLEKVLVEQFGKNAVRGFYAGMTEKGLQSAVDDFQNDSACRFMLCDPLGGEGRNFQMADRIIHIDLPWNPSELEQRIGRLDRIGRKGDVLSVVIYAQGTIEEQLLQIWKEGLQIFKESLSGIEIAIEDIQSEMTHALARNLRFGLEEVMPSMNDVLEKMRERVQEERYFDMARQLDRHVQEQLMNLIEKFDARGGAMLAQTMMKWAQMTGLHGKSVEGGRVVMFDKVEWKSMIRTLFLLPDNSELLRKAERTGEIRGTFMREVAVEREKLSFYAPGNSMFDSIVNNAQETDWGRSTALEIRHADFDWEGIVYTWSVSVDSTALLSSNEPQEHLVHAQGYTPLEHYVTAEALDPNQDSLSDEVIRMLYGTVRAIHLGERGGKKVDQFMELFPPDIWSSIIHRTSEQSKAKFESFIYNRVDTARAIDDFTRKINAMKSANLYFGQEKHSNAAIGRLSRIFDALLEGLRRPSKRLESAAYVRMVKRNEPQL